MTTDWTPPPSVVERAYQAAGAVCLARGISTTEADTLAIATAALAATPLAEAMALLEKWVALYEGEYAEALIQMCGDSEAAVVTEARALLASMKEGTDGT